MVTVSCDMRLFLCVRLFLCDVFLSAVCSVLLQILKDEMLGDRKEAVVYLVV